MFPIYAYGSEEQRRKYLPKLATGEWVGCFGLTEPDAGSDLANLSTRAEAVEKDGAITSYRITGQKIWTSFGELADQLHGAAKDMYYI